MLAVNAFIAEVFGKLIDGGKAPDDEALEVELVGNTQVERHIQGLVMSREGASKGASIYGLENGGFYLRKTSGIEEVRRHVILRALGIAPKPEVAP